MRKNMAAMKRDLKLLSEASHHLREEGRFVGRVRLSEKLRHPPPVEG